MKISINFIIWRCFTLLPPIYPSPTVEMMMKMTSIGHESIIGRWSKPIGEAIILSTLGSNHVIVICNAVQYDQYMRIVGLIFLEHYFLFKRR